MLRAIMRARLPTSAPGWAELSTELQDLISVLLQVIPRSCLLWPLQRLTCCGLLCQGNPKIRATMAEVAAHPWVRAGAADVAGRRAASGTGVDTGAAPPVGIGIPESEVRVSMSAEQIIRRRS